MVHSTRSPNAKRKPILSHRSTRSKVGSNASVSERMTRTSQEAPTRARGSISTHSPGRQRHELPLLPPRPHRPRPAGELEQARRERINRAPRGLVHRRAKRQAGDCRASGDGFVLDGALLGLRLPEVATPPWFVRALAFLAIAACGAVFALVVWFLIFGVR
jgi:hypothetical protein